MKMIEEQRGSGNTEHDDLLSMLVKENADADQSCALNDTELMGEFS